MKRSMKPVKPLSEIVLPYRFTPRTTIEGGVNGKRFYFPVGKEAIPTQGEYEALFTSSYKDQL
ncbi:hypothetical protein HZB78_05605 [Candidatus Collierbacteria bacterium]|nr:hypothetical protein [Candidatus Collierbacteria bacterium]